MEFFGMPVSPIETNLQDKYKKAFAKIRVILMTIEGVLTDGTISYTESGDEVRSFSHRDGVAIKEALRNGYKVIVLSDRYSKAAMKRLIELGVTDIYMGIRNKLETYHELKLIHRFEDDECLFIGDELTDIPIMKLAGFCMCTIASPQFIRDRVAYVTASEGGRGAVREGIELMMNEQKKWTYE